PCRRPCRLGRPLPRREPSPEPWLTPSPRPPRRTLSGIHGGTDRVRSCCVLSRCSSLGTLPCVRMMDFAIRFSLPGGEEALVAIVGGGVRENKCFVRTASNFFARAGGTPALRSRHGLHTGPTVSYISHWEAAAFLSKRGAFHDTLTWAGRGLDRAPRHGC